MGERTIDLPSTEVLEEIVGWLEDNREQIEAACDKVGIPKPPPT